LLWCLHRIFILKTVLLSLNVFITIIFWTKQPPLGPGIFMIIPCPFQNKPQFSKPRTTFLLSRMFFLANIYFTKRPFFLKAIRNMGSFRSPNFMNIQLQRDIFSIKPGPLGPTHHAYAIAHGRSFPMSAANTRIRTYQLEQVWDGDKNTCECLSRANTRAES
jgi:hypothetical protein